MGIASKKQVQRSMKFYHQITRGELRGVATSALWFAAAECCAAHRRTGHLHCRVDCKLGTRQSLGDLGEHRIVAATEKRTGAIPVVSDLLRAIAQTCCESQGRVDALTAGLRLTDCSLACRPCGGGSALAGAGAGCCMKCGTVCTMLAQNARASCTMSTCPLSTCTCGDVLKQCRVAAHLSGVRRHMRAIKADTRMSHR